MRRFVAGFRFRLIVLVLLALIPSLGLIIYTASEQRQLAAVHAEEHALQVARDAAKAQQDLVSSTHELLSVLAQLPAVRDLNPTTCNEFLAHFLGDYSRYTSITVRATKDGAPICRATPKNGPIPAEPGIAHVRALEAKAFAVGDYQIGKTSGKGVLPFGYPINDARGDIQAVLMVALDLDELTQLAAQAVLPTGSTLMVIDSTGKVLVHYPDPELWAGKSAADAPVVKAILARRGEGTVEALGEDDISRLYAFTPLTHALGNNVYVSVGIPSSMAYAAVNESLTTKLIALAAVAVLALGAAWLGGDWFFLRQVNELVSLAQRLAKGDLHARAGQRYSVGELEQLARAFDNMGESLEQQETARKEAEDQIRRWSGELEQLINGLSDAISQSLEVARIAEIALARTLRLMNLACGVVFLRREDRSVMIAKAGLDEDAISAARDRCLDERAGSQSMDDGQIHVDQVTHTPAPPQVLTARQGVTTWIYVPIKSKARAFGMMCLASQEDRLLRTHEQGVLAAVGQLIGVAIENAELHEQVQSIAALQERERLSRELHDGLAQVLGYLCIRTEVARDSVNANRLERAVDELEEMQAAVQQAHQDLRESILGLRATIHPQGGLASTLKEYLHKFSIQSGIAVSMVSGANGQLRFSPEAEVQLLRIIQEGLANIRKHSGARQAWIRFEQDTDHATVTIEDNGKGFDPALVGQSSQPRFGLQTMCERAEGVGGSLRIFSQPGQGTRIIVNLPIRNGDK